MENSRIEQFCFSQYKNWGHSAEGFNSTPKPNKNNFLHSTHKIVEVPKDAMEV